MRSVLIGRLQEVKLLRSEAVSSLLLVPALWTLFSALAIQIFTLPGIRC